MDLLFVTNLPAPYRVDFFNEMAKYCNLTVCYERYTSKERDTDWKNENERAFKEIFCDMRNLGTDKSFGFGLICKIRKEKFDHLIISGYSSPSVMLLITYCRFWGIPFYIETDGGFNKKEKFYLRALKRFLICKAKGIFTTCRELEQYFISLGYKGHIYKYPLSSFFKKDIFNYPATYSEKSSLREELGMIESKILLTVGRFSYKNGYGKGYDTILKTAKLMNDTGIGWYIVGGEPTEEFVRMKEDMNLPNVHFIDFVKFDLLKKYYRAADVFLMMTIGDVWGLVINEAMACGLPIITTDRCIAGVEMVENGENGYVISVGDCEALAEKISDIITSENHFLDFSTFSLKKANYYTIENMVKAHIDVLN